MNYGDYGDLVADLIRYWDRGGNKQTIFSMAKRLAQKSERYSNLYFGPDYDHYLVDFANENGPFILVEQIRGTTSFSTPQIVFPWLENDMIVFGEEKYDSPALVDNYDGSGFRVEFLKDDFIQALKTHLQGYQAINNRRVI